MVILQAQQKGLSTARPLKNSQGSCPQAFETFSPGLGFVLCSVVLHLFVGKKKLVNMSEKQLELIANIICQLRK